MWRIRSSDSGFSELGQTWSQPKVARIRGNTNPVLIFGAGYDTQEDKEPPGTDTMGRGIFIVDAVTGALLWHAGPVCSGGSGVCTVVAGMTFATPADITLVDRDFDGYIDRLYASDLGGNIWRVDLEPQGGAATPKYDNTTWAVTQLASLGGSGATKRKFFYPPDVVLTKNYDVVLAVTGDREHPLITNAANQIVNRFYMIKDTKVGMSASGWTTLSDNTSATSDTAPTSLFNATTTAYDGSLSGFYISLLGLDSTGASSIGEKGVNAPTTVGGIVYFGTNQPYTSAQTCQANLGKARSYGVSFLSGKTTSKVMDGGGMLPSPVFGMVTVQVNGQDRQLPFLIGGVGGSGADSRSGLGAQKPPIPIPMKKQRTYWTRQIDP
jgi:type IV pilus assembly protein PilY1